MTITECINYVDSIEPNAYSDEQKQRWIRECEGKVYRQIFGMQPWTQQTLEYWVYSSETLTIPEPWDKIYPRYLQAMIHYANGEYDRYAASMQMFNEAWAELNRWFGSDYDITDRGRNRRVTAQLNMLCGRQILMTLPTRYAFIGRVVVNEPARGVEESVQTRDLAPPDGQIWIGEYEKGNYLQQYNTSIRGSYPIPMVIGDPGGTVIGTDHDISSNAKVYVTGMLLIPEEEYDWHNGMALVPVDVEEEEEER